MEVEKLVRRNIKNLRPYKPGKPIEEVKRELGLREIYKLASNENPLGTSPRVLSVLKKSLSNLNRYPEASCYYLKNRLAEFWNFKPENFIIGNGSDEIITLTLRAFLNPGEEVIVSKPTFLIYELASKIEGADLKIIPLKNFRYDLEAISQAVTDKTKIIFIANPDNPCGTYVTRTEIEYFLRNLPEDIILFVDEAYYEFVEEREDFPDSLRFVRERPLIVTRTFSKVYGLAGLRIGYGIASSEIVQYLDKVREPFNVNSLAQKAALAALDDQKFVSKVRSLVYKGRKYLFREFERLGIEYVESCTNFILINVGEKSADICDYLLKNGVIVRNMSGWGLDNCIRVTVGLPYENKKFIRLLERFIKKEVEV